MKTDETTGNVIVVIGEGEDAVETLTYLRDAGGVVEFSIREDVPGAWEIQATAAGIYVQDPDDEEGNTPPLRVTNRTTVVDLGAHTITPAVTDADGNVVTPAVKDERRHFNVRLGPAAMLVRTEDDSMFMWEALALTWMSGSSLAPEDQNSSEQGRQNSGLTLLDQSTIAHMANQIL